MPGLNIPPLNLELAKKLAAERDAEEPCNLPDDAFQDYDTVSEVIRLTSPVCQQAGNSVHGAKAEEIKDEGKHLTSDQQKSNGNYGAVENANECLDNVVPHEIVSSEGAKVVAANRNSTDRWSKKTVAAVYTLSALAVFAIAWLVILAMKKKPEAVGKFLADIMHSDISSNGANLTFAGTAVGISSFVGIFATCSQSCRESSARAVGFHPVQSNLLVDKEESAEMSNKGSAC